MIFIALVLIWNVYVFVQFMMQRMKEAELFKEWESQEDEVCSVLSTVFLTFELFPHYTMLCSACCSFIWSKLSCAQRSGLSLEEVCANGYFDTLPLLITLVPRISPCIMTMKSKEGEGLVPFHTWCMAHRHHSYNELICYVTTRARRILL